MEIASRRGECGTMGAGGYTAPMRALPLDLVGDGDDISNHEVSFGRTGGSGREAMVPPQFWQRVTSKPVRRSRSSRQPGTSVVWGVGDAGAGVGVGHLAWSTARAAASLVLTFPGASRP